MSSSWENDENLRRKDRTEENWSTLVDLIREEILKKI